jgi:nucleoside-diphosphate-sugar epimerase
MLTERGYKVRGLVRKRGDSPPADGCEVFTGDLRNLDSVLPAARGADVIFHVAAVSGIWGTWKHFHSSNTIATRNVLDAALQAKVP